MRPVGGGYSGRLRAESTRVTTRTAKRKENSEHRGAVQGSCGCRIRECWSSGVRDVTVPPLRSALEGKYLTT